jgi:predicted DNA-binding ribbon-helix-helix protein
MAGRDKPGHDVAGFADDPQGSLMPGLKKRSLVLAGHGTSLALEPAFWAVLEALAVARGLSLAGLIGSIDAKRGAQPLASACRLAALAFAAEGKPQ